MPHRTALKRKPTLLDYTTDEFLQKLNNRGYVMNVSAITTLHNYIANEMQKGNNCHSQDFWKNNGIESIESSHGCVPLFTLCGMLCSLHVYNINYIHLAIVFHAFDCHQWKNFYRYCYLEWAKHATQSDSLWEMTPRELSNTDDDITLKHIESFLNVTFLNCNDTTCVKSLFLVNRLFKYLIPS